MSEQAAPGKPTVRRLLTTLRRRAWIILGVGAVAAGATLAYSLLKPASYEAVAGVVMIRSQPALEFDERFKTLQERAPTGQDAKARREALLALVHSGAIVETVRSAFREEFREGGPGRAGPLDKMVEARLPGGGDVIEIQVTDVDPRRAARLANAWAREYERYVNDVYGTMPQSFTESVRQQLSEAREEYDLAQQRLEAFLADSRIAELERAISERSHAIEQHLSSRQEEVSDLYATRRRLIRLIGDTRMMLQQVRAGGRAAADSDALAMLLVKAQAFGLSVELPGELQLDVPASTRPATAGELADDLEALLAALRDRLTRTELKLRSLSEKLLGGSDAAGPTRAAPEGSAAEPDTAEDEPLARQVRRLEEEVRVLESRKEAQTARLNELQEDRDLAWETCMTLARKQSELDIASSVRGSVVRFVSPALPPDAKAGNPVLLAAFAGLLGALISAVFCVYKDSVR
jgi:uncharacterized protein involved in exopolysaccharide biosynthesis